ncbi:hypothetical protein CC79DRAFT_1395631, partial [Sarocladium strictum]
MSEADASMYASPADSPFVTASSSRQPAPVPLVSPFLSESAHVRSLQHPSQHNEATSCTSSQLMINAPVETGRSSSPETVIRVPPSPGSVARQILLRAKRGLGSKLRVKSARSRQVYNDGYADNSQSSNLTLQVTQAYLSAQNISTTGTWYEDEQGGTRIKRKLFGKAPWYRKASGSSVSSVNSSIRNLLSGRTPPATPISEKKLNGSFKSVNSQYPGNEAVRINTPPLDEDTADGRSRGFFTASTPPPLDGSAKTSTNKSRAPAPFSHGTYRWSLTGQSQPREWWDRVPRKPVRRDPAKSIGSR